MSELFEHPLGAVAASPWWVHAFAAVTADTDDPDLRLDEAAVLLAAVGSVHVRAPDDVERELARLDDLAARCEPRSFEAWRRVLFVEQELSGNAVDYHDPRNSYVPDVLARRVGIPISLAVIGLAVGRRIGVRLDGVGMPGHFLLCHTPPDGAPGAPEPRYVDAFHGGTVLDATQCRARFHALFGSGQAFEAHYLDPTPPRLILLRMLANLKAIGARSRDLELLTGIMRLRVCLPGASIGELRELIRLLVATLRAVEAAELLAAARPHLPPDVHSELTLAIAAASN